MKFRGIEPWLIQCCYLCYEQMIHDSEAEVELIRLKVDKAREKLAQLKLALREKRGQAKGCIAFLVFVFHTIIFNTVIVMQYVKK